MLNKETITYLTTVDNPWNPFENWDEWLQYDMIKGYNTCQHLSRLVNISDALPDNINKQLLDEAMNKLIEFGAISNEGIRVEYKRVSKPE